MNPEKWKQLEIIYYKALSMSQSERRNFLAQACAGDEQLWGEVESLLAADDRANNFLKSSAFALAMHAMAEKEIGEKKMSAENEKKFILSTGTQIDDRYEILEALDAGGMGEVYKARDLKFSNRLVVVKLLKKDSQKQPWIVRKFQDEGQVHISHSGVVTVLDKGSLPSGELYLVMEFVKGTTLLQIIKNLKSNDQQMSFLEVAEIIKQLGRAVAAIHKAQLIHRDLKPANIMIHNESDTDELSVKVIDFGIVRVLNASTIIGQVVGTPLYMSPEQLEGKDVTPTTDVYALGQIVYEMLTGQIPFKAAENLGHLLELKKGPLPVPPRLLRPALSEEAEQLISKALSYDRTKRQQSARDFGDELAKALTSQLVIPGPPPKPATNRWLLIATSAFVVVSIFALMLWQRLFGQSSMPQSLPANQVIVNRVEGNNSSATGSASPMNERIYEAEYDFPTAPPPNGTVYASIGFTVWRTRPATARDGNDAARETIDNQEMAAERIADTIADGERIYLGIESLTGDFMPDKGGYLYVINREQYTDGSFGRARLIFPTLLTYDGRNRVKPGLPVVLPGKDRPFTIKRSSPNQIAESYIIILSPWEFQLPEAISNRAVVLSDDLVTEWEKNYGGRIYRAALREGVGQLRTKREQTLTSRATIDTAEPLTQDEPLPQTCYKGAVKIGNPVMVTISLRFKD